MPYKTSIEEITVANKSLHKEVGLLMKMDPREVMKITKFVGNFIAKTIQKGQMEGVMIPYFGKFKPKDNYKIQQMIRARERNGIDMVYRAVKGRKVVDKRGPSPLDKPKSIKPRIK